MPAGQSYKTYGGLVVYVKYAESGSENIWVREHASHHSWIVCPDREILIVRDFNVDGPRPSGFHVATDMNLFNDDFTTAMHFDYLMPNAVQNQGQEPQTRMHGRINADAPLILSDSGGYQFFSGKSEAVDLRHLARFYNANCDAGMVLDVPIPLHDMELLERGARLQRKNNKILLRELKASQGDRPEPAELVNIIHGLTPELRERYREIVETPQITRCALAGLRYTTLLAGTEAILRMALNGMPYKQYHLLGITEFSYMMVFAKIAHLKFRDAKAAAKHAARWPETGLHITCDSSTHIQAAIAKTFFKQMDQPGSQLLDVGLRSHIPENSYKQLQCSCVVCKQIKYTDIFGLLGGQTGTALLALHNCLESNRFAHYLEHMAQELTTDEYIALCMTIVKGSVKAPDIKQTLNFLRDVENHGLEKARAKYGSHLSQFRPSSKFIQEGSKALFDMPRAGEGEEGKPKRTVASETKRISKIMEELEALVPTYG